MAQQRSKPLSRFTISLSEVTSINSDTCCSDGAFSTQRCSNNSSALLPTTPLLRATPDALAHRPPSSVGWDEVTGSSVQWREAAAGPAEGAQMPAAGILPRFTPELCRPSVDAPEPAAAPSCSLRSEVGPSWMLAGVGVHTTPRSAVPKPAPSPYIE